MSIFKRNQDPPYNVKSAGGGGSSLAGSSLDVNVRPAVAPSPAEPARPADPASPASQAAPPGPVAGAADPRQAAAVLDRKTEITGTLHSEGNVLVEGIFHGEIDARDTVWVEQGAQSHGQQLRANDVVISGTVDGEIACERRLQIAASAVVTGEIRTPVLVIDEGATINCRFNMEPAGRNTR